VAASDSPLSTCSRMAARIRFSETLVPSENAEILFVVATEISAIRSVMKTLHRHELARTPAAPEGSPMTSSRPSFISGSPPATTRSWRGAVWPRSCPAPCLDSRPEAKGR